MLLRRAILALALLAAPMLTGCAPRWVVLQQATPNVLFRQRMFAVQPIDFSDLHVGTKDEASYLEEKSEDQRASWARDKEVINAKFTEVLMAEATEQSLEVVRATGPASAPFLIRVHAARIEPGFYAVVASGAGSVALEVTITTADGRPVDRIMLDLPASGMSVTQRLESSAAAAGHQMARYLHSRSAPSDD